MKTQFTIREATAADLAYAEEIVHDIEESAKIRGTGIAKRAYIQRVAVGILASVDVGEFGLYQNGFIRVQSG